jgi:hypothetical protein
MGNPAAGDLIEGTGGLLKVRLCDPVELKASAGERRFRLLPCAQTTRHGHAAIKRLQEKRHARHKSSCCPSEDRLIAAHRFGQKAENKLRQRIRSDEISGQVELAITRPLDRV